MQRTSKWITGGILAASLVVGYAVPAAIADGGDDHGHDKKAHKAAGESHAHASPHGGVVKTVGKFHVEFVVKTHQQHKDQQHNEDAADHKGKQHDKDATAHKDKQGDEHGHQQTETHDVWTCSMHAQVRKSVAGKCPICSMKLIKAKDGAAHIHLYIYGGSESKAQPIEAKPLTAYLKVHKKDGFTALTLNPVLIEGQGDGVASHFTALAQPQLVQAGFNATIKIPIEGKFYRAVFEVKPSAHHQDEDKDHGDKDHGRKDNHEKKSGHNNH